ncbi:hypothetical protein M9H77_00561 [Catharanthus roseus]|nr:hypothetical protein M9H77_00503 [Catharanthus roseus]KAI5639236.1 hypothetical protein M9H77_00561 [Catharanthus roseus]
MVDPKPVPLVQEPYQPANELLRIKAKFAFSTGTQSCLASIALAFAMPRLPSWKKGKRQITPKSSLLIIIKILASTACSKKDFLHGIAQLFNHGRVSQTGFCSYLKEMTAIPWGHISHFEDELTWLDAGIVQ